MKLIISIVLFISFSIVSLCQNITSDTLCSGNRILFQQEINKKVDDTTYNDKRIVTAEICHIKRKTGARFEFGISSYYYGDKTSNWLGNHGGPNFNFIFLYDKVNIGFRFKPWTINPISELSFNEVLLPTYARLNPIKIDYYIGYSFDFRGNISLLPCIGYNRSIFTVINEDELQQIYSIPSVGGVTMDLTFDKYFDLGEFNYFSIFGRIGYTFIDYSNVHDELDSGLFEWNLGIAFKGFFTKFKIDTVE